MKPYAIVLLILFVGLVLATGYILTIDQHKQNPVSHITVGISQKTGEIFFGSPEPIIQSYDELLELYKTNPELFRSSVTEEVV